MENLKLNAELRNTDEKTRELRSSKMLAWVVYGKKKESTPIKMDYSSFLKTYRKSWGSHIIDLSIWKDTMEVLVHQIQKSPVSGDFLHIDLFALTRWEKLITKIHINFIWESQAVREWGILEESLKEIEVKCFPKDLIDSFEADLSVLKEIWGTIRVSELSIDKEKYEILTNLNDVVVSASAPAKLVEVAEETVDESTDEEPNEEKNTEKKDK